MKIKCEYCGENINDYDVYCPYCKKANVHYKKPSVVNKTPETIEELKQWYIDRNLPPETTTRFFIGTNYKGARAFGIYQDDETGEFVVYKNKGDGSRAIRYQGRDEKHAVQELYLKLKEEIANQKANNGHNVNRSYGSSYNNYGAHRNYPGRRIELYSPSNIMSMISIFFVVIVLAISVSISIFSPKRGYYLYHGDYYYYQNGSWYGYKNYNGWNRATADKELKKHYRDYYQSYDYSSYYDVDDFKYTSYYVEPSSSSSSSSSSWDSSSDWDSSDSWDSGSTDWDSDW